MPDEAENIGGISVSVGATHKQLAADLAEANRLLDQWAKQRFNVNLGAGGAPGGGAAPAARGRSPIAQSFRTEAREVEQAGEALNETVRKVRRKNINARDIGTAADQGKVYTFDPAVYAEQDRLKEARSAREREQLLARESRRTKQQVARDDIATDQQIAAQTKQARSRSLQELSYINQQEAGSAPESRTIAGTQRTPAQIAQFRASEEARANADASRVRRSSTSGAAQAQIAQVRTLAREERTIRRAIHAEQARDEEVFARTTIDRSAQRERQLEERIAQQRANITASGRTGRTAASGIGALFGGTQGKQIEANARLAASEKAVSEAQRAAEPFRRRIAEYDLDIAASSGKVADARRKARDAFVADPKTQQALARETGALKEQARAVENINKLQSGGNIIRNLAAVSAASAAFGLTLKVIDTLGSIAVQSLGELIDIQTGFQSTATRVTTTLGQQALAFHGNTQAAIAQAAAQANLSDQSAAYLETTLKLPTQIRAGALAQKQASELFRASFGGGAAPQGLFGGFGGVGGGSLFGEQLGGGLGFTEQIGKDLRGFQPQPPGQGPLDVVGGLPGGLADILSGANPFGQNFGFGFKNAQGVPYGEGGQAPSRATGATLDETAQRYIDDLNAAARRGGPAIGSLSDVTLDMANSADEAARAASMAAAAGDEYGRNLVNTTGIIVRVNGQVAKSAEEYRQAIGQIATGRGIMDPQTLARQNLALERQRQIESRASLDVIRAQQAFARPSIIAAAERQQQFALGTQLPARQALAHLAAPAPAIGTGIVAANAAEQAKIVAGQTRSVQLQQELNGYYERGKQVLIDTYKVPPALINQVQSLGQEIAATQAGIRNEQAAYQVAQYNFQLSIARRTLSDIGGLTGKNFGAGQSYLGILERQNLALSRQGQLLQFALSQRQINFQTALAGFQAPGITPEERAARVEEAKIEASFAQKQLDIQRQMFGNQVQIVDISNLRQGADLAAQIGLLLQGRQVTIDTALAEEKLIRLQAQQQIVVEEVGTYLTRVETLASAAFSEIQQLEAAAGKAMSNVAVTVLSQFGIVIAGLTSQLNGLSPKDDSGVYRPPGFASGGVFKTLAPTRIGEGVMGEAAGETVAILAHPRAMNSGGAGGSVTVMFGDVYVRDDDDIDKIARKVVTSLGREASQRGLRSVG